MPSEGLRAQAQRALQKVSHGKKSLGTSFSKKFQEHNPAVPLSQPLGLGHWDGPDLGAGTTGTGSGTPAGHFGTPFPERYGRVFRALEAGCPDLVPADRWQLAVDDGRAFLARWGDQAEALGWTARDLFGLHTPPDGPHPSYSRLSRYDETGLIWLLCGREVVALTEATAAIQSLTGAVTIYRRFHKPALGPVGHSLDDLEASFGGSKKYLSLSVKPKQDKPPATNKSRAADFDDSIPF